MLPSCTFHSEDQRQLQLLHSFMRRSLPAAAEEPRDEAWSWRGGRSAGQEPPILSGQTKPSWEELRGSFTCPLHVQPLCGSSFSFNLTCLTRRLTGTPS